jgi:hypothetical protein
MSGFMSSELIPMRWPSQWRDSSALQRLSNTHINCLLIEDSAPLRSVVEQAQKNGIRVIHGTSELPGIIVMRGCGQAQDCPEQAIRTRHRPVRRAYLGLNPMAGPSAWRPRSIQNRPSGLT